MNKKDVVIGMYVAVEPGVGRLVGNARVLSKSTAPRYKNSDVFELNGLNTDGHYDTQLYCCAYFSPGEAADC